MKIVVILVNAWYMHVVRIYCTRIVFSFQKLGCLVEAFSTKYQGANTLSVLYSFNLDSTML